MSLNAKQPKIATVFFRNTYVEIFEYPRGQKAKITYTQDGRTKEDDINDIIQQDFTKDIMGIMTYIREDWGLVYPE